MRFERLFLRQLSLGYVAEDPDHAYCSTRCGVAHCHATSDQYPVPRSGRRPKSKLAAELLGFALEMANEIMPQARSVIRMDDPGQGLGIGRTVVTVVAEYAKQIGPNGQLTGSKIRIPNAVARASEREAKTLLTFPQSCRLALFGGGDELAVIAVSSSSSETRPDAPSQFTSQSAK